MSDDLAAFCRSAWPRLVRGLMAWTESRAVAEELAQETLIRVWDQWPRVWSMRSPEAWMWRVAINLSRSDHRRRTAEARALARTGPATEGAVHDEIADPELLGSLRALPARQRQAIVLRHVVDLPVGATAEAMGCAEGTVRALTHQGLLRLRAHLGEAGAEPRGVEHDG